MKKLKAIIVAVVVALVVVLPLTACSPTNTAKTQYNISVTYADDLRTIDGSTTVSYVNASEGILSEVMFHLYPRAFREGAKFSPVDLSDRQQAYPDGLDYGDLTVLEVLVEGKEVDIEIVGEDEDILRVPAQLSPTQSVEIRIEFRLKLPHVRHRMGWHDGIANLGNWYPIACVIRDGEFDTTPYYVNGDPFNSDIADYNLSITVPQKYTVATSGRQSETTANGQKTVVASLKNARDCAVVIGEFSKLSKTQNGVEVNYYFVNDSKASQHLDTACDAVDYFSNTFGDYIYDTLSVVKNPFLYGGMEYPALVYISDDSRLSDSLFNEIIIHEVAHQWWYAAVGNDQVREAWLDEGFAEYSTTLFYQAHPEYDVEYDDRMADALMGYLLYCENSPSGGQGDTSMNRSSPQYRDQNEYACMTYVKGALLLDAVRDIIGDTAFFGGMRDYYAKHKFGRATADDFIGALERSSRVELKAFFDSWLNGTAKMFAN